MTDPIDLVDVIVDVLECVPRESAERCASAHAGRDGCIAARVEDRTDDHEEWACVTYWAPGFGAYGYPMKIRIQSVEGAGVTFA